MVSQTVLQQLQAEGWHLKPEALDLIAQELSGADEEEDPNTDISPAAVEPGHAELRAALLDCDYRKLGLGCLPDDVNRAHSSSIQGPLVLQVMSVTDVSKPSYGSGSGSNRLLLFKLSDGRISCKAMEHRHCGNLDDTLLPGTKVVLQQANVKLGVVQLEPESLRVLGGRVDSLAEAHEAQRKYGGTNRPGLAAAAGSAAGTGVGPAAPGEAAAGRLTSGASTSAAVTADDGASAPRFKPFVLGRDDSRKSAAAAATGSRNSRSGASAAVASAPAVRPGTIVAAGTSAAIAAAAVGAVAKPPDEKQVQRSVDVAPAQLLDAQAAKQQTAAQARLLEKLERSQAAAADGRGRGRGGFRGRRGRRCRHDEDDKGGGGMTLEEYEAKQKGGKVTLNLGSPAGAGSNSGAPMAKDEQIRRDEELARQLQAQMDFDWQDGQRQYAGNRQQPPGQRRDGYSDRGRAGITGQGAHTPLQYESSHHQQHQHQAPVGVDYTDSMFDNFNYNAGRGRGNLGGADGSHSNRGPSSSRGYGQTSGARGRDAGRRSGRGSSRGSGRGRGRH